MTEYVRMISLLALGDPCPQPTQLKSSMLHPCTDATKLNYFDGSRVGFGICIITLFLFPLGQCHLSYIHLFLVLHCPDIDHHNALTVSYFVACMVAYHRKSRYRKFQKRGNPNGRVESKVSGFAGKTIKGLSHWQRHCSNWSVESWNKKLLVLLLGWYRPKVAATFFAYVQYPSKVLNWTCLNILWFPDDPVRLQKMSRKTQIEITSSTSLQAIESGPLFRFSRPVSDRKSLIAIFSLP